MFLRPTWLNTPRCLALGEWSHYHGYLGHKYIFLYCFFCVFLPPSLNIFCFCPYHFCPLLCPSCMKYSLGISDFLEGISSLSILLFSPISLHWPLRKAFLSLLAILWNSAFRWVYLSFSPLPLASLLYHLFICKASSDSHFAFFHFFFLDMVLVTATVPHCETPSIVLQTLCLLDLIPWIYLSLPLYNCKRFGLGHTWMA